MRYRCENVPVVARGTYCPYPFEDTANRKPATRYGAFPLLPTAPGRGYVGAMRARELTVGDEIAGYRIEGVAGRGGMGVVYRANQLALDRDVALKIISPQHAGDASFRERFKRESRLAASIRHPNVISIYDAREESELLFITMDYVEGTDLRELIRSSGRLEPQRAARIVSQVADALDAAHARGLVHRDIKPANVLIADEGGREHAYLTDFGLTKEVASGDALTKTGMFVGTVDYVAPEQIEAGAVDARTDVYALGCVLFHALTGRVPYAKDSDMAKVFAHAQAPPPQLDEVVSDLSAEWQGVIGRSMAKDPEERYPSAGDLGRAATAAAAGRRSAQPERTVAAGAAAPPPPPAPPMSSPPPPPVPVTPPAATPRQPAPAPPVRRTPPPSLPSHPSGAPPPAPPGTGGGRRGLLIGGIALAVLVVAAVAAVVLLSGGSSDGPRDDPEPRTSPDAAAIREIEETIKNYFDASREGRADVWCGQQSDQALEAYDGLQGCLKSKVANEKSPETPRSSELEFNEPISVNGRSATARPTVQGAVYEFKLTDEGPPGGWAIDSLDPP